MNFDQPQGITKDDVTKKILEAKQEKSEVAEVATEDKKFDPEVERQKIYDQAGERRTKLFKFRNEVFGEAGKTLEAEGYQSGIQGNILKSPAEYEAFSRSHSSALDKKYGKNFEKKDNPDETQLTYQERAALLYQTKYNDIDREMKSAIAALEERIKASKPE